MKRIAAMCVLLAALSGLALSPAWGLTDHGPERIISFDSRVDVGTDGVYTVRETITVFCRGEEIRRGIYRDFPLTRKGLWGLNERVTFDVISVKRDGLPEEYHTTLQSGSARVYMGREDYLLEKDRVYTYELVYTTSNQLLPVNEGFAVYWNVTGNDWAFPVDRAGADIRLPGGDIRSVEGYTGTAGSTGSEYSVERREGNSIRFSTNRQLARGEGLTVKIVFDAPGVYVPPRRDMILNAVRANRGMAVLAAGFIVILLYYLLVWAVAGRDPARGPVSMRMVPPGGLSPAAVRYIYRMGFDNRVMVAAMMSLAQRGAITISERDGDFTLAKNTREGKNLTKDEAGLLSALFLRSETLDLNSSNHGWISGAMEILKKNLKGQYEKVYFFSNVRYFVPGLLLSVVVMAGAVAADFSNGMDPASFLLVWLTFWTLGTGTLVYKVIQSWMNRRNAKGTAAAVFLSLFSIPFVGAELAVLAFYLYSSPPWMLLLSLGLFVLNPVFYHLLKRPTLAGRRIMDEIEGFRMYIRSSRGEGNMPTAATGTQVEFERNLPYAVALDEEEAWSGAFESILSPSGHGAGYVPRWYGTTSSDIAGGFAVAALGASLAGAISSATAGSGSSGGCSGGGGGGGGGGGW